MANNLKYNDPLFIIWRKGTIEDPYVSKSESRKVINNRVVLSEIPDPFTHVTVTGYTEVYKGTPLSTQFIVDYATGIVSFNVTEEAKTVTAIYQSRGIIQYPAERIFSHTSNPDVLENLQEIIDNGRTAIDANATLNETIARAETATNAANTAATSVNTAVDAANTVAANTVYKGVWSSTVAYKKNNSVISGNTIYVSIADAPAGTALTDTAYWQVGPTTQAAIDSANTATTSANNAATAANTAKTNADTATAAANTAKTNADTATNTANAAASNADTKATLANDSATAANTAKTNADAATTQANTARDSANTAATAANTAKTNADTATTNANAARDAANTAKTNADTATANANTATTNANNAATDANTAATAANTAKTNADSARDAANTAATSANTAVANLSHIGSYDAATQYLKNNVVAYNGSSFMAIADVLGIVPTDTTKWKLVASKGDTGAQGIQGIQGFKGDTGTSFAWKGVWSNTIAYSVNDAVSYLGASYVCTVATTAGNVPTDATHWNLMADGNSASTVKNVEFIATEGQTVFTVTTGQWETGKNLVKVFVDGVRQNLSSFTETSSTSITLSEGMTAGFTVTLEWFESLSMAAHAGSHTVGGTDDLSAYYVAIRAGKVGIGTTTPEATLHVAGGARFDGTINTNLATNGGGIWHWALRNNSNVVRFGFGLNTAETAVGNTGSDLSIWRYADDGSYLDTAILVSRATGNVGIGTSSPAQKLHVLGNASISGTVFTSSLSLGDSQGYIVDRKFWITFPNAVANQKLDLYFTPNKGFAGMLEITVSGNYSFANSGGILRKIISIVSDDIGTIHHQYGRYSEVIGFLPDHFAIGDMVWDSANTRFKIPFIHRTSDGNPVTIHVRAIPADANLALTDMNMTSIYTTDATTYERPITNSYGNITVQGSSPVLNLENNNSGEGTGGVLAFGHVQSGNKNPVATIRGYLTDGSAETRAGAMRFATSISGTLSDRMVISPEGNVGINTMSPTQRLQVSGNVFADSLLINDGGSIGSNADTVNGRTRVQRGMWIPTSAEMGSVAFMSHSWGQAPHFSFRDSKDDIVWVSINAGNMGVGTASPGHRLHVVGDAMASGYRILTSDGGSTQLVKTLGTAPDQHIHFMNDLVKQTGALDVQVFFGYSADIKKFSFLSKWNGTNKEFLGIDAASGLVSVDANLSVSGVSSLTGNVGIGTTSPSEKLHVIGNAIVGNITANANVSIGITGAHRENIASLVSRMRGRLINANSDFLSGTTYGYAVYDNNNSGRVSIGIVDDDAPPNSSGKVMQINYDPSKSTTASLPDFGGYLIGEGMVTGAPNSYLSYKKGNRIIRRIWANIPVGRTLVFASNATGVNSTHTFLTGAEGTGAWKEYIGIQVVGNTGEFSGTGYWHIAGGPDTAFVWYVALHEDIDIDAPTSVDRAGSLNVGFKTGVELGWGEIRATNNITTDRQVYAVDLFLNGGSVKLRAPITTGGWARGSEFWTSDGVTELGGIGMLGNGSATSYLYMSPGVGGYNNGVGIYVFPSGNVGIGTTSPVSRLHVVGRGTFAELTVNGATNYGKLASAIGGPVAGDTFYNTATNKMNYFNGTVWVTW